MTLVEGAAAESKKESGKVIDEVWNLGKVGSIFSIYKAVYILYCSVKKGQ